MTDLKEINESIIYCLHLPYFVTISFDVLRLVKRNETIKRTKQEMEPFTSCSILDLFSSHPLRLYVKEKRKIRRKRRVGSLFNTSQSDQDVLKVKEEKLPEK